MNHDLPPEYMAFARKVISDLHFTTYNKKRDEGLSVEDMKTAGYPDVDMYEAFYQKAKAKP